jgi:hypothetical protein
VRTRVSLVSHRARSSLARGSSEGSWGPGTPRGRRPRRHSTGTARRDRAQRRTRDDRRARHLRVVGGRSRHRSSRGRKPGGDRLRRHRLRQARPAPAVGAPSSRRRAGRPAGVAGLAVGGERASRGVGAPRVRRFLVPGQLGARSRRPRCEPRRGDGSGCSVVPRTVPASARPCAPGRAGGNGPRRRRLVDLRTDSSHARFGGTRAAPAGHPPDPRAAPRHRGRCRLAGHRRTGGPLRRERPLGPGGRRGHLRHGQGRKRGAGSRSRRVPRRLGGRLVPLDPRGSSWNGSGRRRVGVPALVGRRARCDDDVLTGGGGQRCRPGDIRGAGLRGAPPLRLPGAGLPARGGLLANSGRELRAGRTAGRSGSPDPAGPGR